MRKTRGKNKINCLEISADMVLKAGKKTEIKRILMNVE
jgi:hypothetical protein